MYLTEMFRHVISLSLLGSILVIGLLLIKRLLRGKLSADFQYCIWFLLFIRLIIPFTPSTPLNLFYYIPHNQPVSELIQMSIPSTKEETSTAIIEPNKSTVNTSSESLSKDKNKGYTEFSRAMSWFNWQISGLAWIIVIFIIFLYILLVNLRLLIKNRKLQVCLSKDILEIVQECKTMLKMNSNVTVVYGLKNHPLNPIQISQSTDSKASMLLNMMVLAKQGKIINCEFAAKTTTIDTIMKAWGQANKSDYIAAAKGTYATYTTHNAVFGFNKGEQIFEIRSFDTQLKSLSLSKVIEIFGTPAYDSKINNEEIIGYTAGTEFKIELVFTLPKKEHPSPVIDHYNVLYPRGTVNSMADDSGRQW